MHCHIHYKVCGGWVPEEPVCNLIHDPLIRLLIDQSVFKTWGM